MTPFEFHTGYPVTEKHTGKGEKVYEMECPFCNKPGHFHFFDTTQFGCKICGVSGNVYEFIKLIYNQSVQDLGALPSNRLLPERALAGIKFNRLNKTFVLPTYKQGKMNNLYKTGLEMKLLGTPTLTGTLYDWDEVSEQEVWLCEGQWDRCAAKAIIGTTHPVTPIGIPGANTFKESWVPAFQDKDVLLIFDKDDAGEDGLEKTVKVFEDAAQKPKSLRRVVWPEDAPKGFDLRDFYALHGRKSYSLLQTLIHPINAPQAIKTSVQSVLEDFTCDSYDKALDHFETAFHTTSDMRTTLACTLASIYSVTIPGEQVWFKIVATPGSGKGRIAKAVSGSDYVVSRSTFTGLFSGWVDDNDADPGLIPLITGKTLLVKDADALLRQSNIEKIMSELRDFYDKDTSVQYRTRKSYEYRDVKSTIIIAGTQVLRRADQSFLGERFLTLEMDVSPADEEAINQKMMQRSLQVALGQSVDPEVQIMSSMKGFINHLRDRKLDTTISEEFQQDMIRLCSLTALMRTSVDRDFRGRVTSPAMAELPTRLIGQMVCTSLALGAVFGKNQVDNTIFNIVQKIMRDTINPRSNRFKICSILADKPNIDAYELMEALPIPKTTLQEELSDLAEIGLLHTSFKASDSPGRQRKILRLDDRIVTPLRDVL